MNLQSEVKHFQKISASIVQSVGTVKKVRGEGVIRLADVKGKHNIPKKNVSQ